MKREHKNPIVQLSEFVQKRFGENIETRLVSKKGADHEPTITAEIELPDGKKYSGTGLNKREAKQSAAKAALLNLVQGASKTHAEALGL